MNSISVRVGSTQQRTQSQVDDPDPVTNVVTATGFNRDNIQSSGLTATATYQTDIDFMPALSIMADGPASADAGTGVEFTYLVTYDESNGDGSPVNNVVVNDSEAGPATFVDGDANDNGWLDVGRELAILRSIYSQC